MSAQHLTAPLRITADVGGWSASHEVSRGTSSYVGILAGDEVVAIAVARDPEPWSDPDPRPIAERIVQCVNAHDELVAALRRVLHVLPYGLPTSAYDDARNAANKALAAAGVPEFVAIAKATGSAA